MAETSAGLGEQPGVFIGVEGGRWSGHLEPKGARSIADLIDIPAHLDLRGAIGWGLSRTWEVVVIIYGLGLFLPEESRARFEDMWSRIPDLDLDPTTLFAPVDEIVEVASEWQSPAERWE